MPWPAELTHRYVPTPLTSAGGGPRKRPSLGGLARGDAGHRQPGWPRPLPELLHRLPHPKGRHLRALVGCETVLAELPLIVDGGRRASPAVAEHLRSCASCQAEQASYERLLRALRSMREDLVSPAPGLLASTLGAIQGKPSGQARGPRRAAAPWALGAAGLMALSAGALLAWAARRSQALAG
jgi:hypothetical protein